MYRLLIIDDEPQIVNSIYEMFMDLPQLDLDISRAYSGFEALEVLNKNKIDIVISDICMPRMDGLTLCEKIHNNWPLCKVIFLTGHNEFDYAFRAIRAGSINYILKSEDEEVLINAVQKAILDVEKSFLDFELAEKVKKERHLLNPLLQNEYLEDLLVDGNFVQEISQEKFQELELPMIANIPVLTIYGKIDDFSSKIKNTTENVELIYAIKVLCEKYLSEFSNKIFFEYKKGSFLILIQQISGKEECSEVADESSGADFFSLIKGRLEIIQSTCRETLNITISIILDREFVSWSNVKFMIEHLKQLLDYCYGLGNEIFISENNFPKSVLLKTEAYDETIGNAVKNLKKLDSLIVFLEKGNYNDFMKLLSEIIDCLKQVKSKNYTPAHEIYFAVSSQLLSFINKWRLVEKIAFRIGLHKLSNLQEHTTWSDAVAYIYDLCNSLFEIQKNEMTSIQGNSISAIQEYIDGHLGEDLSLNKLSEMVYFNPSYFSRLFKQATGKNVTSYILEARIAKAKKFLSQTDMKIQDISVEVGAETSTYFCYIFKRATNFTPNEYRDKFKLSKDF